jgi:hypothetical protein
MWNFLSNAAGEIKRWTMIPLEMLNIRDFDPTKPPEVLAALPEGSYELARDPRTGDPVGWRLTDQGYADFRDAEARPVGG